MPPANRKTPEYRAKNRVYQNDWYQKNRQATIKTRRERRERLRVVMRDFKAARGCKHCSESDPVCLDLHHPDPQVKDVDPSRFIDRKGWSPTRLVEELNKLEVLCANCHRKLHAALGLTL